MLSQQESRLSMWVRSSGLYFCIFVLQCKFVCKVQDDLETRGL